jgi:hypothetical protein
MNKSIVAMLLGLLFCQGAYAITIGADQLLGTIDPGTPANLKNEMVMVNGLLEGWGDVKGYNDGALSGTVLGDNPDDPNRPKKNPRLEVYTLRFSSSTYIPDAGEAPLAVSGKKVNTCNTRIHLGKNSYEWVLAKWGKDSAVYYIGGLTGELELTLGGTGWDKKGHGLSHYTLFHGKPTDVPDGGLTISLLGLALGALGLASKKIRQ